MSVRRKALRHLIREYERVSARLVRALRADDPSAVLDALVSLRAFADEGIAWVDEGIGWLCRDCNGESAGVGVGPSEPRSVVGGRGSCDTAPAARVSVAEGVRCPPLPPPEGGIIAPGAVQGQGEA